MPLRTFVRARANGQKRLARTKVRVACQRITIDARHSTVCASRRQLYALVCRHFSYYACVMPV
eukprot:2227986-Rhodomonas_salina.1